MAPFQYSKEIPEKYSETFSNLVCRKWEEIEKELDVKELHANNWHNLSAILITKRGYYEDAEVICLATGNHCIQPEISDKPFEEPSVIVNNSHAEFLVRQAFCYYLFQELLKLQKNSFNDVPSFILKKCTSSDKCELKDNIGVHLVVSSPPCGDANIYKSKEADGVGSLRGILTDHKGVRTMESMDEEYFASISCSDKLMLWNVTGIQGALLFEYLNPVYLRSITVISDYNYRNLNRALHGRIKGDTLLEDFGPLCPFRFNIPEIGSATGSDLVGHKSEGDYEYSLNWIKDHPIEIIDCVRGEARIYKKSGRVEYNIPRVSEKSLYDNYCDVWSKSFSWSDILVRLVSSPQSYRDCKFGGDYIRVKDAVIEECGKQGLGKWRMGSGSCVIQ